MLVYMDKKRYMVTDCAVSLCKKLGKGGVSGFVNAFLRRFDVEEVKKSLPQTLEGEAIQSSYPLFAYALLKKEEGLRLLLRQALIKSRNTDCVEGAVPVPYSAKGRP